MAGSPGVQAPGLPDTSPQQVPSPPARRRQRRWLPLDTGGFYRTTDVDQMAHLVAALIQLSDEAAAAAAESERAADTAAARMASASGGGPLLPHLPPASRHRRRWQPQDINPEDADEVLVLAAEVRELVTLHEACADVLVAAAAELPQQRLQQLLVRRGREELFVPVWDV